ncbi:MAG: hypothetical protein JWQ14_471 [Adhaeribacter sp.]|nr:hypothetical protein [Adhaeribacter sp.]
MKIIIPELTSVFIKRKTGIAGLSFYKNRKEKLL